VSGSGGTIDTGSFATTGSNTFNGAQIINNAPLQVSNYNETSLVAVAPTVFQGVGTSSVAYQQYINDGNYDCVHIQSNLNAGSDFQDLPTDTFVLNTWLNIPTNTGDNPPPQFKRGLGVTGSVSIANDITASRILLTNIGTSTAIQYNQQSSGSVPGQFATSYGRDNLKIYQYQSQPYAFNINLNVDTINPYTGSQFKWGLQVNGNDVSLPGGGGTYFSMVSGSTTGSGQPGQDKLGLNYLGTSMILDMNADTSFRRGVYVDKGMFVSQSQGGTQRPALTVDGTNASNSRALVVTGSVDINGTTTLQNVIQLADFATLSTGSTGQLAMSGSQLYFYTGGTWRQVSLV
jgi:hypothetical protein